MLRWDFLGNFKEGSAPVGITHDGEMFVIMLGASITNSLVDTLSKRTVLENQLSAEGMQARVFDKATGGDKSGTLLVHIRDEGLLDPFLPYAAKCRCLIHVGGNDVSAGAYPSEATLLDDNLREIVTWLQDRGFNVMLSPISYRVPPASNPAEPYNTNVVEPIINEFMPEWVSGGIPIYNLYKYFVENQSVIAGDGIHLTDPAGMNDVRENAVGQVLIDNITQNTNPSTPYLDHLLLNVGDRSGEIIGDYCNISIGAYTTDKLVNTNFSGITNGTQIVASGGADNLDGRVLTANLSPTILNSGLARRGLYGGTISFDFTQAGLDPTANYTVKFMACRDSNTGDRWGEVTVNGITQDINAEQNPPTVLQWTGVSGAVLASATGLISTKKAGSAQMYVNGIEITKE